MKGNKGLLSEKAVWLLWMVLLPCFLLLSCAHFEKNKTHQNVADASIEKGRELAGKYCQSCHQLPQPSLLSSAKWEKGVLPQMGPKLGIFAYGFEKYPSKINDRNIGASFYPDKPVISLSEWQNIIDYYTSLSPDSLLPSTQDTAVVLTHKLFAVVPAPPAFAYHEPLTGCVYTNTGNRAGGFFIADMNKGNLVYANGETTPADSVKYKSPVACVSLQNDTIITANIGYPNPNDGTTGSVQEVLFRDGKFTSKPVVLTDGLRRPVHVNVTDLNRDGLNDVLVCEFGNLKGALSWLENKGGNRFEHHIIKNQPGAIATVVKDFNKDGLPDFYVLFAQGDEQIVRFENKGNGMFEEKQLLRFPPAYGSSYFEMDDIDKDGDDDIIYTCGDNADYSVELKPYHGVYIFTNDGKDHFTQQYFFHINGCFKAMARDFDGDGDTDIAAISFFADYKNRPEEGFVYLRNEGGFHFTPYSMPAAKNGRWISMDVGDVDRDGKPDILLGNFSFPSFIQPQVNWKEEPPFLLLKNQSF